VADVVVQPSGTSLADLRPAALLFHELSAAGIPTEKLLTALCWVGTAAEETAARDYMRKAGYDTLAPP
jgi:chromosome partitioning protein